jgi:hypothetical protein
MAWASKRAIDILRTPPWSAVAWHRFGKHAVLRELTFTKAVPGHRTPGRRP